MDIKDSYLHSAIGVVKSIDVGDGKLSYTLADVGNTRRTFDLAKAASIPFIVGTLTQKTSHWTGTILSVSELYDGLTIRYWVPYDSADIAVDLNLTLSNGTNTGQIECYYRGYDRLTTHIKAGSPVTLTYRVNPTISGVKYNKSGWWMDADNLGYNHETFTNGANISYKKVVISKDHNDGFGILVHSRAQHYLISSGLTAGTTIMNTFYELGTNLNGNEPSTSLRYIHIKMIATAASQTVTLYIAVDGYTYFQIVCSDNISIQDSTESEYNGITSSTTGWVSCKYANWNNTTYSVFKKHTDTNAGGYNGLVPVPSYTTTTTRFLREDGTWVVPTNNKVLQGVSSNSKFRCLLLGTTQYESTPSSPSEITGLAYITKNIYVDPSKATLYADTFVGKLAYTNLTGSTTTANQAIVSNGTADGWTLKTLGSNAFNSTAYLPLSGGTLTGALTIKCTADAKLILDNIDTETNFLYIDFRQNNTSYGTLGITTVGGTNLQWAGKTLLHTGNYSTTLDGRYYTESEIDTKLGNYVTIDTTLTITGSKRFNNTVNINTNTNTTPLKISRLGSDAECLSIGLDDATTYFHYKNDELGANFKFIGEWTNTGDNGNGDSPGSNFVLFVFSKDSTKILLNDGARTHTVLHSGIAYIENGTITINGTSITPLTSHLSLANYVTLNTAQTITGAKTFTASNNVFKGEGSGMLTINRNSTNPAWVKFMKDTTTVGYLGIRNDGTPTYGNSEGVSYVLLHSGNYTSYLGYIGTTAVLSSSKALELTGITKLTFTESSDSYIGTTNGYISINSHDNEICISGSKEDILYINYREGLNEKAPETWCWKAGSSTSWANFKLGNLTSSGLTATKTLKITSTDAESHIAFSRGSHNYITTPSGGNIHIVPNGGSVSSTAGFIFGGSSLYPGVTNTRSLGTSDLRWTNVYSIAGNYTGDITAAKFITSGGTSNLFVKGDGSLDNTTYATSASLGNYVTLGTDLTITGLKTFKNIIYGNLYNNSGNKAGAYLILNKGGNYLGIGASSTNVANIAIGESNLDGTWVKELLTINTSGHVTAAKFITSGGTSNLFVKGDGSLDDSYYNYRNAYDYRNGYLVKLDISDNVSRMCNIHITGNSYNSGTPINTYLEFYAYYSENSTLLYRAIHYGLNFGNIEVFLYNKNYYLWFLLPGNYTSFSIYANISNNNKSSANSVLSISDETIPTEGISRHVTVVPTVNNDTLYIEGTGTSEGVWLGEHQRITKYQVGLTILYKIPIKGKSSGVTLNINNLGAKSCKWGTSNLTTHYSKNNVILFVYDGTNFVTPTNYNWCVYVNQYKTNDSTAKYPVLFRYNTGDPSNGTNVNEYTRYDSEITIHPSTNTIHANTFEGSLSTLVTNNLNNTWKPGKVVSWFSNVSLDNGYAGNNTGFPSTNNANGILWLGTHSGSTEDVLGYGHQLGFSSNKRIYHRAIVDTLPTTTNGGSWFKIAYTTDNFPSNQINALTGYAKATSAANLATTDSLNTALGKLEYKAHFAYNWVTSVTATDTDNVINKWDEIVDFINNITTNTDLTDEFVTRKTAQTITGAKTFTASTNTFGGGDSATYLTVDRNSTNPAYVCFKKNGTLVGYIGVSNDKVPVFNDGNGPKTILHSGNYSTTLDGRYYTETEVNNLLKKYLPLTGGTLTGDLNFGHLNTNTNGYITWTGGTYLQRIKIEDNTTANTSVFTFQQSTDSGTNWSDLFTINDDGTVIASTFLGRLAYTNLTGSGTTANQAIVSTGTKDGWTLKTLGSRAFDSTAYLPIAGGTMGGNITMPKKSIVVTSDATSNYVQAIKFYKGTTGVTEGYDANIGWHNTGDNDGAIILVPYTTTTDPWGSGVGLYISKTFLKYNNNTVLHSGNYIDYTTQTRQLFSKKDYEHWVVLLCKIGTNATSVCHRLSGKIHTYTSGSTRYQAADVDLFKSDWTSNNDGYLRFTPYGLGTNWKLVTCTYKGSTWLGISNTNTQATIARFDGTWYNISFTAVHYYTSNTSTVVDSEINSSIQEVTDYTTVLSSENYNLYSPKLDGTGATGTWGINISGVASKVSCTATSNNTTRPIVLTNTSSSLYYTTKATINYSTGNITAPTFTGNLVGSANKFDNLSSYVFNFRTTLAHGRYNKLFSFYTSNGEKSSITFNIHGKSNGSGHLFYAEYQIQIEYKLDWTAASERTITVKCLRSTGKDLSLNVKIVKNSYTGSDNVVRVSYDVYTDLGNDATTGELTLTGFVYTSLITRTPSVITSTEWDALTAVATSTPIINYGLFTANSLVTARKFTIGNTEKSFDGTQDLSWSSAEIGYRHEWRALVKCATWSRLCYVVYGNSTTGSSYIINIKGTRNSVVYNYTYLVTTHHGEFKSNIVQIGGSNYSNISVRACVNTSGTSYFELYDTARDATSATTQYVNCTLIPISCGRIDKYIDTFTDGTTLTEGFIAGTLLDSQAYVNSIQATNFVGNLIGNVTGNVTGLATSATKVYVNNHTTNNTEYPLVWSNAANTENKLDNLLYKSYNKLTYNPSTNTVTATTFKGNATSASKWATARTITLGGLLQGSVDLDGSKNIDLSGYNYWSNVAIGGTNLYPYHRIISLETPIAAPRQDVYGLFRITLGYNDGYLGILKVSIRTNSGSTKSVLLLEWVYRKGFALNSIQAGFNDVLGNTYVDIFYKSPGAWAGIIVELISNTKARGVIGRGFTLLSSKESADYVDSTYQVNTSNTTSFNEISSGKISADGKTTLRAYTTGLQSTDANIIVGSANKVNSTLTFAEGSFAAKTFNGSAAVTVNVPTKTSHLTNDSGYLTSRGYIGTTAVQANSAAQALTGITNLSMSGLISINNTTEGTDLGTIIQGKTYKIGFLIGNSNENRGIYDYTNSKWALNLDSSGNVKFTGTTYFGGGTSYYFGKTGDVKCNLLTATNNVFLQNGVNPCIYFKETVASNAMGVIYYVTKKNTSYDIGRFLFRQYSYTANSTTKLDYYENYYLPDVTTGLTSNATYYILTSKDYSSYLPILNSSSTHATKTSVIYAPTTAGTAGQVLVSSGSGAPTWGSPSGLTAGSLTPIQLFSGSVSVSSSGWTDIGTGTSTVKFDSRDTGTYAIQITSGTNFVASGIFSVYKNLSNVSDEIPLHVCTSKSTRLYLRTMENKLQIASNDTSATSWSITIKIAKIL